jgi:hypothetical protein
MRQQMRQCQCQDQANFIVNVTGLLPTVADVLPAEKGNETLVKLGLLPCCRFSGPASQSGVSWALNHNPNINLETGNLGSVLI